VLQILELVLWARFIPVTVSNHFANEYLANKIGRDKSEDPTIEKHAFSTILIKTGENYTRKWEHELYKWSFLRNLASTGTWLPVKRCPLPELDFLSMTSSTCLTPILCLVFVHAVNHTPLSPQYNNF